MEHDLSSQPERLWRAGFWFGVLVAAACVAPLSGLAGDRPVRELTLREYVRDVLSYNESLQARALELAISRSRQQGEAGIFEPELVTSYQRIQNDRPNTVEQQRQQFSSSFSEENNLYQAGLESLAPTGARIRLGYSLSDLRNNLQTNVFLGRSTTNGEFLTFVGLTVTQPILKNAGYDVAMAGIRLAAVTSDVAFEEYRRFLMEAVTRAEAYYWQLYFAQEQHRFFAESVAVAENLLRDNREKVRVGKSSELEVKEAEAALALRRSKLEEAEQKLVETSNSLLALSSAMVIETNLLLRAVDRPRESAESADMFTALSRAMELNPDYRAQRRRAVAEEIRLGYARNQKLLQVDVKGSVGWYGLGEDFGSSWQDAESGDWPSWSLGLEMRLPLGGGRKARKEYEQAQFRDRQAQLVLQDLEIQMVNGLDSAIRKVQGARQNTANYRKVVEFYEALIATQQERVAVGQIDSQRLLETEEKLLEAKSYVAESLVMHERALLELELFQGTVLVNRHLDLSRDQLEARTAELLRNGVRERRGYDLFVGQLRQALEQKDPAYNPNTPRQEEALDVLQQTYEEMRRPAPLADHTQPEVLRQALEELRKQLEQTPETRPTQQPPPRRPE